MISSAQFFKRKMQLLVLTLLLTIRCTYQHLNVPLVASLGLHCSECGNLLLKKLSNFEVVPSSFFPHQRGIHVE